jgi:hypothetical protein
MEEVLPGDQLLRVHFPDSKLIDDDSKDGLGQQNLDASGHIMNRGDWNLAIHVITQSKIRWALGTCGNRWNCTGTSATSGGIFSSTSFPYIQSLHGMSLSPQPGGKLT